MTADAQFLTKVISEKGKKKKEQINNKTNKIKSNTNKNKIK